MSRSTHVPRCVPGPPPHRLPQLLGSRRYWAYPLCRCGRLYASFSYSVSLVACGVGIPGNSPRQRDAGARIHGGRQRLSTGVIAHRKRAHHRQQRPGQFFETRLKGFPRGIEQHRRATGIESAPTRAPGELLIFVGGHETHAGAVEFAEAAEHDRARRHIDAQRQRVGGKDGAQHAGGEKSVSTNHL